MNSRQLTLFLSLWVSASVYAGAVVYTDKQHPPINTEPDTRIIWLDMPQELQDEFFGRLPADPQAAAIQVYGMMQSTQWQAQEQALAEAYREVVRARELGITQYPAVVFNDSHVVYGTADVAQARALYEQGKQQ